MIYTVTLSFIWYCLIILTVLQFYTFHDTATYPAIIYTVTVDCAKYVAL